MSSRFLTVSVAVWLPIAMFAADSAPKPKPPAAPRAAKPAQQMPPKAARQAANQAQAQVVNQQARAALQALNASNLPAGLNLQRLAQLSQMSQEERAAALGRLPPAMQQRIEQRVENFQRWPPDQQARVVSQYERFSALPPERKEQARESLTEYLNTPPPRKGVIALELNKMGSMTEEQRANYMGKPAFRSRFSESEIQMMNNLHGIVP